MTLEYVEESESPPEAAVLEGLSDEQRSAAVEALAEMMAKVLEEEMHDD